MLLVWGPHFENHCHKPYWLSHPKKWFRCLEMGCPTDRMDSASTELPVSTLENRWAQTISYSFTDSSASPSSMCPYLISWCSALWKHFFFFFFLPCHSLLLEFREMVNPERGNQGLSFVSPGKNSKTFLGTDWSRTTRPLLLRGNGTYWYKANFVFKK